MVIEELLEPDPMLDVPLLDQLMYFIAMSRTDSSKLAFSAAADEEMLDKFNIVRNGVLYLRPDVTLHQAIDATRTIGSDGLWSDDRMYAHLTHIAGSFPNKNETSTSSRVIIDTFFFRTTCMIPSPQKVIVMLENHVPVVHPRKSQTDTVSGIVDYTAIVLESTIAQHYIQYPPTITQKYGDRMIGFFVAEAKYSSTAHGLKGYLPQVLLQLVACGKRLGKHHIRGALTTGFMWIFVVMDLDTDGDGAKYWISAPIQWIWDSKNQENIISLTTTPALIAGILSSWIPESFAEFNGDQWFEQRLEEGSVQA